MLVLALMLPPLVIVRWGRRFLGQARTRRKASYTPYTAQILGIEGARYEAMPPGRGGCGYDGEGPHNLAGELEAQSTSEADGGGGEVTSKHEVRFFFSLSFILAEEVNQWLI